MSAPTIPPRPMARPQGGQPTEVQQQTPSIPPRPVRNKMDNLQDDRDAYSRSPFNLPANGNGSGRQMLGMRPPPSRADRPPSINLPSDAGQEGLEYTSYDQLPKEAHGVSSPSNAGLAAEEEPKNVTADVPLQQPRASHPQSTAKSRISTVTRTDSTQAAAAGIGKARPDDDVHTTASDSGAPSGRATSRGAHRGSDNHPLRTQASFDRSNSSLRNRETPRPSSVNSMEHHEGIPEIGMQIPLHPDAGDVQAPSPAPSQPQFASGMGFFNDGSSRSHHRKRSSRHEIRPPGSYGMHGHGHVPSDQFERDWYAKHPDEALKESHNVYSLRPETALSSDQLNRIVSENQDIGVGTSPNAIGTPSQDVAFEATEQFSSRYNSPKPSPLPMGDLRKRPSSGHQPPVESPLKRQSFPFRESSQSRNALESEDEEVIHVDEPHRRGNKITGGGSMDNTVDLGPTGGNTEQAGGLFVEHGEGTPILASDELLKRPSSAFLTPAVEPDDSHAADDDYYDSDQNAHSRRNSAQPTSRPSSRPSSVHGNYHGGSLHRFISHEEHHGSGMGTPLEEIEEYEPLFPEDDGKPKKTQLQRPGLAQHHFPSQDVWEDTPDSLQYMTTVETPEPPRQPRAAPPESKPANLFETPEDEQKRRTENPADMTSDSKTFAKPHFKSGVQEELHSGRPGPQRFPSRDIWEDTPDSMRLVTTVSSPQMDEMKSPPEDRPTTNALPGSQDEGQARSTTGFTQVPRPSVPARPERKSKLSQEISPSSPKDDPRQKEVPDLGASSQQMVDRSKPTIPERSKPTIPARPTRSDQVDGAGAPLSKSVSATSAGSGTSDASTATITSPPVPKAKPVVPARPAGSKIAALQAGFMSDLNKRLQLGPQAAAPKVKEPETEGDAAAEAPKEPLTDARKGRARGPARRKPAASPGGASTETSAFSFSTPMTLFQINEREELSVPSAQAELTSPDAELELERALTQNEAKNTEEPTMLVKSESMSQDDAEAGNVEKFTAQLRQATGFEGDMPDPSISPAVVQEQEAVKPELEAALAGSSVEEAPVSAQDAAARDEQRGIAEADQGGKDARAPGPEAENTRATAHAGSGAQTMEEGDSVVRDLA